MILDVDWLRLGIAAIALVVVIDFFVLSALKLGADADDRRLPPECDRRSKGDDRRP